MEPREKVVERTRADIVSFRIKPGEIYDQATGDAMGLTAADWLKVASVGVALQQVYKNTLDLVFCGSAGQVSDYIKCHVASTLGMIQEVEAWEAASREFFETYRETCLKCKTRLKVQAAKKKLSPVMAGQDEGR
ncbi:MAG TPA: hypothetical protein VM658_07040 [bacterium]|nr:hypothetical protein [bacterium]